MADRREIELRLHANGKQCQALVDGRPLTNITRAVVTADVEGLTEVEITYVPLGTPFILRGQMVVVYDGPADGAPPAPRLVRCKGCGKQVEEDHGATQINPDKPWQPFPLVGDWWCLDCIVAHKHEGAKP